MNNQETVINVKILKSCILLSEGFKRCSLSLKQIQQGLAAFELMERFLQSFGELNQPAQGGGGADGKGAPQKQKQAICMCKDHQKYDKDKYSIHAGPDCPFKKPGRVTKWLMKNENQRGRLNLPMDEEILFMTMALIDFTMSTALIRKWLSQVRPYLECEQPERKAFEKTVRTIQDKHKETIRKQLGVNIDVDASSANRIMPHEFLFLLANAKPRLETMERIKHPVVNPKTVESRVVCEEYELQDPAHRMNRNRIFNLDTIKNFNPRDNIYEVLDQENNAEACRVRITGMERTIRSGKNLEQDVLNQIKKDKLQAQKQELIEANKKKKKDANANIAPSTSMNSQQLSGLMQSGDPQSIKVNATFNKRKQSASSNISSSRWDSQRD